MSVAKPLPHDAAPLHVTGAARYVDDIPLPGNAVHLAFGTSTCAHGTITGMDLSAVRAAPGVIAVMTADDLPYANDVSPSPAPEPLLAEAEVHYIGQPVFLVVADTHLAARAAARLGEIIYEPRPAILSIDDALAADARFEDGPRIYARGDAAKAIVGATHVIEGSVEMGGQEHFYLEGQAAIALPQEGGDMVIGSSTQHPTEIQHKVADALGLPMNAVKCEIRRMGGGFGGKESQGNSLAIACALAARATGRAASMRYDRDDDMMITGKRHDFRIDYRAGVSDAGLIEGIEFTQLCRCGWSQDLSLPVADRAMLHADNAYFLPNVRIESHRLRTNTQSATAFRGFGGPQGMFGIERVMDHISHTLGADPVALRQANYYGAAGGGGPAPHTPRGISAKVKGRDTTPYGQQVEDFILHAMTERLLETSDYAARGKAIANWNAANTVLKKGIAFSPVKFGISFTLTHLNQAGALVHVYQDGSIMMNHGGTEMGQGLFQKVAQVAAARFGVDVGRVKITASDTSKVPNTSATAASSGSDLNGMAVQAACDTIRERLAEHLGALSRSNTPPPDYPFAGMGLTATDFVFRDEMVRSQGKEIAFADAVKLAYMGRISLSSTGFYATPKIVWDRIAGQGRPFYYFAYGAAVTEVVIDTLTGENRILRADLLHDCGASLNPALDIGQIEGGYVQGAGWLTTEELVWDDAGRLRTHAPATYKIPAMTDRPGVFNVALWDGENREETVYRSKAVGEPPLMLGISAWLALSNACAAAGPNWPDLQAPATAEAVLAAANRAKA